MIFTISSAMLDACILSILEKDASYGYALNLEIQNIIECSESTLYPVLRRLEKAGALKSFNKEFNGRNRKFYEITDEGKDLLSQLRCEWKSFKNIVDNLIIKGGKK